MPQVSKRKLDKDLENEIFKQFWNSLGKINDSGKSAEFFSDLLTETEKVMLAKRFSAAVLITRGKSATEIKDSIHLAYSTINSVSAWTKNAKPKTKEILNKISIDKNWETVFDKIDAILDKLPPKPRTDWTQEFKDRNKRVNERFARKSLR